MENKMNLNTNDQDKYKIIYNTLSNGISDIEKEVIFASSELPF